MEDLISRSALLLKLRQEVPDKWDADINYFICNAPTVEAEPAVHCKDCVYWGNVPATGETEKVRVCEILLRLRHENFFCSDGAKMDGNSKV